MHPFAVKMTEIMQYLRKMYVILNKLNLLYDMHGRFWAADISGADFFRLISFFPEGTLLPYRYPLQGRHLLLFRL